MSNFVFDHVGTALFGASLFALGVGGRLVACGNSSGDQATIPSLGYLFHSTSRSSVRVRTAPTSSGRRGRLFCDGDFPPMVDSEFALADAAAAQDKLARNDVFGKIVLRP